MCVICKDPPGVDTKLVSLLPPLKLWLCFMMPAWVKSIVGNSVIMLVSCNSIWPLWRIWGINFLCKFGYIGNFIAPWLFKFLQLDFLFLRSSYNLELLPIIYHEVFYLNLSCRHLQLEWQIALCRYHRERNPLPTRIKPFRHINPKETKVHDTGSRKIWNDTR